MISTNAVQAADSCSVICLANCESFISCLICGPLKIPALIFSILIPGNALHKYRKHAPSVFNDELLHKTKFYMQRWDNDLFCGNQGLMNDVFLACNHFFPQRPLFLSSVHFLLCYFTYRENKDTLYNPFAGTEESLPFLGLHIFPTDA